MPLDLEVVTPNRVVLQEQVDELNVPGELGYLGILPGHIPFLTTLGQGELMYRQGERRHYIAVFRGYMEVNNDKVTLLVEVAEPGPSIDRARAESARDRADDRLGRLQDPEIDFDRARAALERATIRLQVSSRSVAGVAS